ncbi:5-formyltetrahydrofolate cyclo-ligase-like [Amphibalanus amphitrite]|uniref:5-formyltetrahydrofolate cyclo-ligase-like n=1 Tax=Amphibalanus amphitrite TaxID=1232801 RepID=UPI001C8FF7CF|nr:5-formyltetrahydrofolate cyclo-ligase-like [Amphibalanus amphitrite]
MSSPAKMAKSALRKRVKAAVSQLSSEERARQSQAVTRQLLALPQYQQSQRVSVYLSMPDEIQTGDIVADLLRAGKQCFIPRYESGSSHMDMVRLHSAADLAALPTTKWNIQQPSLDEQREEALQTGGLDLILMPGLAFSRAGHRLGRGRGYYDRYLTRCREAQQRPPVTVALAFAEQLVDEVPVEETDVPVDVVLCAGGEGDH